MESNKHTADAKLFTARQRATIEAATARIIPTDHSPGALEAGVIEYIERLLGSFDNDEPVPPEDVRPIANFLLQGATGRTEEQQTALFKLRGEGTRTRQLYFGGAQELDKLAQDNFGADGFCALDPLQQDRVLSVLEEQGSPFFFLLIKHTMEGFYGDPRHGGNKNRVGWKLLGFPGARFPDGYQPPLGWYDIHVTDDYSSKKK